MADHIRASENISDPDKRHVTSTEIDATTNKRGLDAVVIADIFARTNIAPLLESINETLQDIRDQLTLLTDEKDPLI